jgi:hypothetical protein
VSACSPCVPIFHTWRFGRHLCSLAILGDERENKSRVLRSSSSLCRDQVSFVAPSSTLPHPQDRLQGHPGEQASEALSVGILHQEIGDKVFGKCLGATTRLRSCSFSPIYIIFRFGNFDIKHGRQSWCCCGVGLPDRSVRASHLLPSTSYYYICRSARFACMYACG